MSVVHFVELSGRSSESFEDAIRQAVERATSTIRNVRSVWAKEFEAIVENDQVTGGFKGSSQPGLCELFGGTGPAPRPGFASPGSFAACC